MFCWPSFISTSPLWALNVSAKAFNKAYACSLSFEVADGNSFFFLLSLAKFLCFLTPGRARAVHKVGMEGSRGVQSADSAPPGPILEEGNASIFPLGIPMAGMRLMFPTPCQGAADQTRPWRRLECEGLIKRKSKLSIPSARARSSGGPVERAAVR